MIKNTLSGKKLPLGHLNNRNIYAILLDLRKSQPQDSGNHAVSFQVYTLQWPLFDL